MPSSSTTLPDGVTAEPTHRLAASINHQHILQLDSFTLENGEVLSPCPVAYTTWGNLDEAGRNSLLVCHAFSGSADVSEWWAPLLGEGRALDPALYFIVCVNVLGSAYGTASPLTRPVPGAETYGPTFPATTIRDDVRLQYRVLEHLGVRSLAAVVGGSMGGMHTVEWGAMYPGFIRSFIAICTCAQHSAWGISWGEAQRQSITADPLYLNGYYPSDQQPEKGLAAARMAALLTYRTRHSFEVRFARRRQKSVDGGEENGMGGGDPAEIFSAQSYLQYQGRKFCARFDANCYIAITRKLDTHDLGRGREGGWEGVLGRMEMRALIVGVTTDVLFPLSEQEELARCLPNAELLRIESTDGHDGFLLESEKLNDRIVQFLGEVHPEYYGGGEEGGSKDTSLDTAKAIQEDGFRGGVERSELLSC